MFDVSANNFPLPANGLFGYISYDAVQYFTEIQISDRREEYRIPEVKYCFYKYVVAIDHHKNQIYITESLSAGEASQMDHIHHLLVHLNFSTGKFKALNGELSNISDREYMEMVAKGIAHCRHSDISQIVLSASFPNSLKAMI